MKVAKAVSMFFTAKVTENPREIKENIGLNNIKH